MRKDIVNIGPVPPIVHKPRNTMHKTFGENKLHGDFTFNNHDYDQGNFWVKTFGHRKFISMFWRLFFPMIFYGLISSIVSILYAVLIKTAYPKSAIGSPIYLAILLTISKFNFINIFVSTAWVLMCYPIVGNYLGKNKNEEMRETVRLVFYMMLITCTIAFIFEYIYAPELTLALDWKFANPSQYVLSNLQAHIQNTGVYWSEVLKAYQWQYSINVVHFVAFASYLAGLVAIYVPMFASRKQNSVLIISTVIAVALFLITYCSYLFTHVVHVGSQYVQKFAVTANGKTKYVDEIASFIPYKSFLPVINVACGLYLGYLGIIPFIMFIYTCFPRFFKSLKLNTEFALKQLYNQIVDVRCKYEYKHDKIENKKIHLEQKIAFYKARITRLKEEVALLDESNHSKRQILAKEIAVNQQYLTGHINAWTNKINQYQALMNQYQEKLNDIKPNNKTIFYLDWNALNNVDNSERNFLWFFNLQKHHASFEVSWEAVKMLFAVSFGILIDQVTYGVVSLALTVFLQNFAGNILGIAGTNAYGGAYYHLIYANAGLISTYLGSVYAGFVLLPQYFVAYYLGRGDRETAYHNSMIMMNWSFIIGLMLCAVVLIYASFINKLIYVEGSGASQVISKLVNLNLITWNRFYLDCFYMELILAIVEIFDASTALSYFILVAGGCKWTVFVEQSVRITGTIVLIVLYKHKTAPGIDWFNFYFSANMFVYYMIGRSHSVIPSFIAWILIERGTALRSVAHKEEKMIAKAAKKVQQAQIAA